MTTEVPDTHRPMNAEVPLALKSNLVLGPVVPEREELRLSIKVKRELFRFRSQQEWVNKAKSWYANCGVRQGFYIAVDAQGHVIHMGKCFMAATERNLYPVVVYELQTNWLEGA